MSRICIDKSTLFLVLRNGSSCEDGCLVWSKADHQVEQVLMVELMAT